MKTSFFWSATLIVALTVGSCSVNDEIQDNAAVRFTATVNKAAAVTKAAGVTWGNDAIGIFMVKSGTTEIAESATNRQYTTPASGTFTAATGNEIYYPMNGSTVDFIAYYPYENGAVLTTSIDVVITTIQNATNQPLFDLLYSTGATGSKAAATTPVELKFSHKLSKIVMNCTADASVGASLTGMAVTIKGMNTENTFDLSTGTLGVPTTVTDIIPCTETNGSVYDAIIMPGNYAAGALTVEFALASTGEVFTWSVAEENFEGGNEYTYDVTLTRTGIIVTGVISPWITLDNYRGTVTAE